MSTKITGVAVIDSTVDNTPIGQTTPAAANFTTPLSSDNSQAAATTAWAKFGLVLSLASTGYIKFPAWLGGLIIQWGLNAATTAGITFPLTFPTAIVNLQLTTVFLSGNNGYVAVNSGGYSTSGFTPQCNNPSVTNCNWLAIGY